MNEIKEKAREHGLKVTRLQESAAFTRCEIDEGPVVGWVFQVDTNDVSAGARGFTRCEI